MSWKCEKCHASGNVESTCDACGQPFPEQPVLELPDGSQIEVQGDLKINEDLFSDMETRESIGNPHARIYFKEDGWVITRLHKRRQVGVNDTDLDRYERFELSDEQTIILGDIELEVRLDEP